LPDMTENGIIDMVHDDTANVIDQPETAPRPGSPRQPGRPRQPSVEPVPLTVPTVPSVPTVAVVVLEGVTLFGLAAALAGQRVSSAQKFTFSHE
jgi:hypothetical protein